MRNLLLVLITANYRRVKRDGIVLKCAAGWLIPDEVYNPDMEQYLSPHSLPYFRDRYDHGTLDFISDLQECHDTSFTSGFVSSFIRKAKELAKYSGMDTSVLA